MTAAHRRALLAAGVSLALVACSTGEGPSSSSGRSSPESEGTSPDGEGDTASVSLDARPADAAPWVAQVDVERMMADIDMLAATPRDPVENPQETQAAADHIASEFSKAGLTPELLDVTHQGVTLPVVWAQLPGRECQDSVFVLTGHYDTVPGTPGADDDASGIAGMLEIARILAEAELPATVVLAGLPFEEAGPPYPASGALGELLIGQDRRIIGMISAEMLGYGTAELDAEGEPQDYLMLLGYAGSEDMVAAFQRSSDLWVPEFSSQSGTYPPETDFISRSDHMAFHLLGVPAMFATDGANFRTPHYHQDSDTPDNIVQDFLENSVKVLLGGVVAMVADDLDGDGQADACS